LKKSAVLASCVVAVLSACGGGDGGNGATFASPVSPVALSRITQGAPAAVCPSGGLQVDTGVDQNGNGLLDTAEVTNTTDVCNEAATPSVAQTLLDLRPEPAGTNCAAGGTAIVSGVDQNRDGVLSPAEATATSYVCNSTQAGNTSLLVTTAAPATRCAAGGVRLESGVDLNGNGVLDTAEITHTSYVCHGESGSSGSSGSSGTPGLNSLLDMKPEPAGANCPMGGTAVSSGLDRDRDGVLSASEVFATRYICDQSGGDTTPPVISTNAPAIASSNTEEFTTFVSDNVELAYVRVPSGWSYDLLFLPEGVKSYEFTNKVAVQLGTLVERHVLAADVFGNIAKKTVTIASPKTGVTLGTYTPIESVVTPAGFDCYPRPAGSNDDGRTVRSVELSPSEFWTTSSGFWPRLTVYIDSAFAISSLSAGGGGDPYNPMSAEIAPHTLSAKSWSLDGTWSARGAGGGESYVIKHKATVDPVEGSTNTVSIMVTRSCNINNTGYVDGVPMRFQASLVRPYS